MIKYVLFDLDGTLVDTSEGILESIRLAVEELGIDNINAEDMIRFIGPPLKTAFIEFCGMSSEQAEEVSKVFRKYYNEKGKFACALYPQMRETLSELKQCGYTLVVATSKPTVFAMDILKYLKIEHFFDEIVGSNMDNTRSAKHEVIQYILDKYNVRNLDQVVMIGDKSQDLIGAEKCRIHGIGVTYGFGTYEELAGAKHDVLLPAPQSICDYLRNTK